MLTSHSDSPLRGPHGEYFEGWGQILTDFVDSGFFGFVFLAGFVIGGFGTAYRCLLLGDATIEQLGAPSGFQMKVHRSRNRPRMALVF
jgi:hypothetical protein